MKFLPSRMLGGVLPSTGTAWGTARGAWRALLLPRMKILPDRTALKTLDPMALCTDRCLPPSLDFIVECNSTVEIFRMLGDMQETAGFDL